MGNFRLARSRCKISGGDLFYINPEDKINNLIYLQNFLKDESEQNQGRKIKRIYYIL